MFFFVAGLNVVRCAFFFYKSRFFKKKKEIVIFLSVETLKISSVTEDVLEATRAPTFALTFP